MKCDLCKHEETGGKLLCTTCTEAIGRLLKITMAPELTNKPLAASDARATSAGAMF